MTTKMKIMMGASLLMMTFSFCGKSYAQTCTQVPDCATLGFTDTSCQGGKALKCPFDQSKLFCVDKTCHVGDIFYSDNSCSSEHNKSKTAIGVVFDEKNKLVVSLSEWLAYWNDGSTTYYDIPDLANYASENTAKSDMDGEANTETLLEYSNSGQSQKAAVHCNGLTIGGQKWFLPSAGQLCSMNKYFDKVDSALSAAGGTPMGSRRYWSSTEIDDWRVFAVYPHNQTMTLSAKNNSFYTRCVFSY